MCTDVNVSIQEYVLCNVGALHGRRIFVQKMGMNCLAILKTPIYRGCNSSTTLCVFLHLTAVVY